MVETTGLLIEESVTNGSANSWFFRPIVDVV